MRILNRLQVVLLLSATLSCRGDSNPDKERVIGILLPASGQAAKIGSLVKEGFTLAEATLAENQAEGKPRLRIVYRDTEGKPDVARREFIDLIRRERAVAIVGSILTSDAKGFMPEVNRLKIPVVANGASAPDLRGVSPFFFRNWPSDDYEGELMANYAFSRLGKRAVAILFADDPYPRGISLAFKKEFTSRGGRVLIEEAYDKGESNFDALVRRILRLNPDSIYIAGFPAEMASATRIIRSLDSSMAILSAVGIDAPEFYSMAGRDADNIFYTSPALNEGSLNFVRFKEAFTKKYNKQPEIAAATSYDALMIVGTACWETECTPASIASHISRLKHFPGASGDTTFDSKGDVRKPISIKRIEKGKPFLVESFGSESREAT
jgi:branched-chain amino acid transport system substrate-binding protein